MRARLVAPTALLLDLVFFPFFPMDLSPHLGLRLAVSCGSVLLVIVDGIIQCVFEFIETRKYGHGRIEMVIAKRSSGGFDLNISVGVPMIGIAS